MTAAHVSPLQWDHAISVARQSCARIFRDGGTPEDAMNAFGIARSGERSPDWARAVDVIAQSLCATGQRRAA